MLQLLVTLFTVHAAVVLCDPLQDAPSQNQAIPQNLMDRVHGVKMGIPSGTCDDAKTNNEIDWDGSPVNYTCFTPKRMIEINEKIASQRSCVDQTDPPWHICMDRAISYADPIPTSGSHRPLWPRFGEYKFVPPQRWIHNLEHGAVVMLYDPCTHPSQVNRLRTLVTSCIRKHIITPYDKLPADRPLALLTWGCKLVMNHVVDEEVVKFIRENGLHAPEQFLVTDGQYDRELIEAAKPPFGSNIRDEILCPFAP